MKYEMPALTDEQLEYEIAQCLADIELLEITLKNGSSDTLHHVGSSLVRQKIALAALTAEPVKLPCSWQVGDSPDSYFNEEVFTADEVRDALKEVGVSYTG